jgi:hypothetical protein
MRQRIVVRAKWDPEVRVWVAKSDDLPLVTEAATIEALAAKLPGMIQDLMEDDISQDVEVPFELVARFTESVRVRSRAA